LDGRGLGRRVSSVQREQVALDGIAKTAGERLIAGLQDVTGRVVFLPESSRKNYYVIRQIVSNGRSITPTLAGIAALWPSRMPL
jgi:hypothetical protein